jgi:hypothetical protein
MKLYLKPVEWGIAQTGSDIEYRIRQDITQAGAEAMKFVVADSTDLTSKTLSEYTKDTGVKDFVLLSNFDPGCVHVYMKEDRYYVNDGRHKTD